VRVRGPLERLYDRGARATVESEGPYTGMTPAEIEKLAAWKRASESSRERQADVGRAGEETMSTIEIVPRAPGIEGLTPRRKPSSRRISEREARNERSRRRQYSARSRSSCPRL